jgi:hypothetical protein
MTIVKIVSKAINFYDFIEKNLQHIFKLYLRLNA